MTRYREIRVSSVEELIQNLEPVEQSEISSDIRQNVRAELKRIRRNVSLILGFLSSADGAESDAELKQAIAEVRQECIAVNGTIAKILMLQRLHLDRWSEQNSQIGDQYEAMAEAMRKMCTIAAPMRVQELTRAL